MTKPRRDPAELAALIEQGIAKGLDLIDSVRVATGKPPRSATRALALEHRKAVEANRRSLTRYRMRAKSYQSQQTTGAAIAGVTGAIGVIDVVGQVASSGPALPGSPWMWFATTIVGVLVSLRGRAKLRRLGPEPAIIEPVAPPPALPNGRPGSTEIARFSAARVQIMTIAPALEQLYPGSGAELRRADYEAAAPLTALAERLVVLDKLERDMPGTAAARTAAASGGLVRVRLADGCAMYDELLAAAARLLAAPDVTRSTAEVLGPAIDAMLAYTHGLAKASDL